jgi:uncharacterized membrane protein
VGGTGTFAIGPKPGLTATSGTARIYTATVTITGGNGIGASFPVSFMVKPQPVYGVSLSKTGTHVFEDAYQGYTAIEPLSVTVANAGTNPTGTLALALSGINAASFTLTDSSISSIAAGETGTFTVVPKTGLTAPDGTAGTYTATVSVSGGNGIAASFDLNFTVKPQPVYGVSLSHTGTHAFDDAYQNYTAITPLATTVANAGTNPTGALVVALSGTNAGSFTLTDTSISSIAAGGNGTFTVVPKTGLTAAGGSTGTYTATVTVSGGNGIVASFSLSFRVKPQPVYGVSLSKTGTHVFDDVYQNYTAITPLSVTVANAGTNPTGALAVALSGTNASSFALSTSSISNIAAVGIGTFTVVPKTGLTAPGSTAGIYTATVTVSGGNGIAASFYLSFTVKPQPVYGFSLSKTGTYAFDDANVGYTAITPLAVTITNTGNQATGSLIVALSGTNAASFALSATSISSIAAGETGTFTLVPKTGLTTAGGATGTYTATVTVAGGDDITASFDLSFTVKPQPAYGVSLSHTGTHVFDDADQGYTAITTLPVTVANAGNQATGALTATLSGTNAGSFTLSAGSITSIAAGGARTFTIGPKTGLTTAGGATGTYTATVTVSGGNGIIASFNMSFTVKTQPAYGVSLSHTGTHVFDDAYQGYTAITPLIVTVANAGNQATGALAAALSGTNAASFALSATSLSSFVAGGARTFTIGPKTGLMAAGGATGTYTATVTVSGDNGITASFNLSFTVRTQPAYGVSLSNTGTHIFDDAYQGYAAITPLAVTVANAGNQATGALAAALSGTNAGSFTLSAGSIASIAVGGSGAFAIGPKTGLTATGGTAGTYTATVTVSGDNGITASFGVRFTVNAAQTYGIALDKTDIQTFADAYAGYATMEPLTVTVSNTGNHATGGLLAALSGANAESFALSTGSITSIAVGGTGAFTVAPNTGLGEGSYTATVTVSGNNGITASFNLSFTVTATPTYGVALSVNGTYAFPGEDSGYGAVEPLTVTVSNTGNQATGGLFAALSGANAGSFALSTGSITSIAAGGTGTFTVVPNTGLTATGGAAGTYTATVTVSGSNGITASFGVSFTVTVAPTYGIALDKTDTQTFADAYAGYAAIEPLTVTVANTGNQATGGLFAALSGANAGSFALSAGSISSIAAGGTRTFTVAPNTGLGEGSYTATVTVSGGNGITASFGVNFTVTATPTYGVALSVNGTHAFPGVDSGYGAVEPLTVTVSNTGNQATGGLFAALSGANAGSFALSTGSITSIAAGGTGTFTIAPNTGLSEGSYTATVTVSGGNGITASFGVSFTVTVAPTYGVALSVGGIYAFPGKDSGYGTVGPLTVTVSNTGNQATGGLLAALSGASAESFALSTSSITSIAVGGTGTFTVAPNTGLGEGAYTAIITVTGGNGITASFGVSFTVTVAPTYGVALSVNGTHAFPSVDSGYGALVPLTVTVSNTGNQATGGLLAALSGTNSGSFALSTGSLSSIAAGGTGTFTVAPNTGLGEGSYTATVTVSGGSGITASFGVSFTVTVAPTYSVALSVNGTHAFLEDGVEYVEVEPLTVTVTNTGNQATGSLLAALSGANAGSFALSTSSITSITAGGTGTFTVVPNTGLSKGTYTATVTVSGGNDIAARSFGVSFTVGDIYTRAASMEAYLTKATGGTTTSDPVSLRVKIGAGDWAALRGAINAAGRFVALDLSPSFPGVSSIGNYAFQWCAKLASVNFPEATSIGGYAFQGCTGLTSASFPEATSIEADAFASCTGLTSISFPKASSIGGSAFYNCTGLTSASFPEAISIARAAFTYCTGLITASFPKATSIDSYAFELCIELISASFPEATSIEYAAFYNCGSLTTVNIPKITFIGVNAFISTDATPLTITMGSAPPMVEYSMFSSVSESKTVTVRVPSGAVAAYDETWQDAFKGVGNDPDGYTGTVNSYINLIIQGY